MYSGFPSFKKNPIQGVTAVQLQRSLISGAKEIRRLQLAHGHQALHAANLFQDVARGDYVSAAYRAATFPATRKQYKTRRWPTKYQRISPSRAYSYRKRYRSRNLAYLRKYRYKRYPRKRKRYSAYTIRKNRRHYYRRYTT